ncbi:MAG: transposase [Thermaerobacter sp.]|nr:transposase [Thermaerobacter sp.]
MKTKSRPETPSFVCEVPLRTSPVDERVLNAGLEAARQLYNACLGEACRRWELVRQSKAYRAATAMPHSTDEERKERAKAFSRAKKAHGFSDYGLQRYAVQVRRSWLGEHLDVHVAQKLATRAFGAQQRVTLGLARRVRFKGKNQMDTVEGKSNDAGIRWRDGAVEWRGLALDAVIDRNDPVVNHGLSCRVKYVRIVRRKMGMRNRFSAQLVLEGEPYRKLNPDGSVKYPLGKGTVGLDAGPPALAAVGEDHVLVTPFCGELMPKHLEIRRLSRKLDRQRRANNPGNYHPNGTIRKGPKKWRTSLGMKKTQAALGDAHRTLAAHRKSLQGRLVNRVLALGDVFLHEDVSIRGWQKRFGKSVGFRAPGMFFARLSRKAESAGGAVRAFPTRTTALSQVCHCGHREKKPRSLRWHRCPACGAVAQRDLYSAYLASFVEPMALSCDRQIWLLNAGRAQEAWPGGDDLLRAAFERLQAETNGRVGGNWTPASLGLKEARLLGFGSEPVATKAGATVGNRGSHDAEVRAPGLAGLRHGTTGPGEPGKGVMGSSGRTPRLQPWGARQRQVDRILTRSGRIPLGIARVWEAKRCAEGRSTGGCSS